MWSSQTRARTRVPCIGRQILNHCATREALFYLYFYTSGSYLLSILYILVYICQSQSPNSSHHHPPPLSPPLVSIRLFSTSVSLFLPCKLIQLYHFSRFHIYALIYNICFSLSDLLHSVWQSLDPSKEKNLFLSRHLENQRLYTNGENEWQPIQIGRLYLNTYRGNISQHNKGQGDKTTAIIYSM